MVHHYKGFELERDGYPDTPWNIRYKGTWVGYGTTMKSCKIDIDCNCFDEEKERIDKYGY